jgi:GTPase SAR1 family protein
MLPDYLFKFLVIGNANCGKSCLLHQFIEGKCASSALEINSAVKQESSHTIGVEFGSKVVNVGGKAVKLQIWDTAGQERFKYECKGRSDPQVRHEKLLSRGRRGTVGLRHRKVRIIVGPHLVVANLSTPLRHG